MKKLVRKNIRNLIPYSSARSESMDSGNILLDANELPFNEPLNRYPDPFQKELKQRIASMKGLDAKQIFLGNGSDECIDLVVRAFCEPKRDNIVTIAPSYGMYHVVAQINNVKLKKVNLRKNFDLDTTSILKSVDQKTKLLILCNPNNPTANSFSEDDVLNVLNKFKGIVLIDEAYIDFSDKPSFMRYLSKYQRLIVTQTLSKSYGLAGIRLGMLFANPFIVSILNKVKYPYNVNSLTIQEAINQIERNNKKAWIDEIVEEKKLVVQSLEKLKFVNKIYPSDTNFLLVKFKQSREVYEYLKEKNIIVRDRSQHELTINCLRITIGNRMENKRLIDNLENLKL